ncbi:MAG: PQQ-binding-like beta-propeller repeat protein [Candidatus Bathyarchaeota archaeon]|nr:PQQ-binding-like beta-propeller repeat protein [Candidatus Bathyarchaeota archaeon]
MNQNIKQTLSLILLLSFAVSIISVLPMTDAQTAPTKPTYAFISATPNPVGVGQETLLHIGITEATNGTYWQWKDLTATVTKPDGTKMTLGPFNTDSTGGTGTVLVPDQVGVWKLQTHFPEQKMVPAFTFPAVEVTYLASDSQVVDLVVQEDPIPYFPPFPLPTEYWNRPINAQFYEWAPLTGNWLRPVGSYSMPPIPKYMEGNQGAPETAHILWTTQYAQGGMTGGEQGNMGYEMGDAYVGKFLGTVVIDGVMYYNRYQSTGGTSVTQEVVAVNLKTGEELWVKNWNNSRLAFGQVYNFQGFNYYGAFAYLWTVTGTTWDAYDALTGRWVYRITNVPAASPNFNYYGERGEIIRYTVNQQAGWMAMWNSSKATNPQTAQAVADGSWDVPGSVFDGKRGIQWNVTIPKGLPGSVCHAEVNDCVLGSQSSAFPSYSGKTITSWAISTKEGCEGQLIFNKTWTVPSGFEQGTWVWSDVSFEDRVFIISCKESLRFYGFDLDNGNYKWTTEPEQYLQYYDKWYGPMHAYGLFLSERMSGQVIAYDIQTGQRVWNYNCSDPYAEILWSENFPTRFEFATDGKVYISYAEHSPNLSARGAPMVCLNATTGEEIWRISWMGNWWGGTCVIGDSIMAGLNAGYDNRIYSFGKGPSETTVSASPKVSEHGSKVLVEGFVNDLAPGASEYDIAVRFPNGLPAVSDDSMTAWMQYVYMQYPRPTDVTGVEVNLYVLDPNNNYYHVGSATSDANGFYSCSFVPEVAGDYTVIASFDGTKSFWGSSAVTAIAVEDAAPAPTDEPKGDSIVEQYFVAAIVGIIIAIIVVGIVIILMLRKR